MSNSSDQVSTLEYPSDNAARQSLAGCATCHMVSPVSDRHCPRCGSKLSLRNESSVQITVALVVTAMLLYIPANILPIMTTTQLGNESDSTIVGGIFIFLEHHSYFIALVIFVASLIIPIAKMSALLWLCFSVTNNRQQNRHELALMYRLTEFIGKWSMIDVFVVAILVALVQLTGLMTIQPGIAISAFAGVVILTMIAAHQFDMRLIWDKLEQT